MSSTEAGEVAELIKVWMPFWTKAMFNTQFGPFGASGPSKSVLEAKIQMGVLEGNKK